MRGAALAATAALVMAGCATGTPPHGGASGSADVAAKAANNPPDSSHTSGPVTLPRVSGQGCRMVQGRPNLLSLGPGALTGV